MWSCSELCIVSGVAAPVAAVVVVDANAGNSCLMLESAIMAADLFERIACERLLAESFIDAKPDE